MQAERDVSPAADVLSRQRRTLLCCSLQRNMDADESLINFELI